MDANKFLASRMETISASGIRRIFDLAATMTDPIDFSMGQPDFPVPESVKRRAAAAIEADCNGYTVTHGLPELRDAIHASLDREFNWDPAVFVTCGVSGGLALVMMACLDPGDEVVFPDPYFVSYPHLVNLAGGRAVPVDTAPSYQLSVDRLADAITDRTKAILINSPGNPTGVVLPPDTIARICRIARERDLLIVSDEIYNLLSFDAKPASPVAYAPERTVLLRGFGKSYGMTGWRMGFAAGPPEIVSEMAKLQQYTFVCAPHPFQKACVEALKSDMSDVISAYRAKRDLVAGLLSPSLEFPTPAGGFFCYCKAPAKFDGGTAFVEAAIKRNVLTVPGNVFSQHDTHFRISYAAPDDRLRTGCQVLCELAESS